jgi:hypothetical protein
LIAARYFLVRRTFIGRDRRPAVGGYRDDASGNIPLALLAPALEIAPATG